VHKILADSEYRYILQGQPGIGKSVFGWYMIFRLRREQPKRTILYYPSQEKSPIIVFPGNGSPVMDIPRDSVGFFRTVVGQEVDNYVAISDSCVPDMFPFPTVIISSPGIIRKQGKGPFNKYNREVWMPIPSEQEIRELIRDDPARAVAEFLGNAKDLKSLMSAMTAMNGGSNELPDFEDE
jgi:hypothetical protein